jgi:uncharacterized protein (UPF0548 family)
VFRLFRPSEDEKRALLAAAREAPPASPHLLSLTEGFTGSQPKGFAHDLSRSEIGRGQDTFVAARKAFLQWVQFDLGWVQIANPSATIRPGQLVGVEAHTACLWSINLSRIAEIVDTSTRFGFMYTTTAFHIEEGQERFVIDFDSDTGSVSYLIEAVSRPRHPLARIGYPFSRATQHRFARDSHARMRRYLLSTQPITARSGIAPSTCSVPDTPK